MSHIKATVADEEGIERTITRLAHEILEDHEGLSELVFVGIHTRGVPLAERILDRIENIEGQRPPFGQLDITLYRDDFRTSLKTPEVLGTKIPFNIDDKDVILVDDVLYTGRTIRAALDEIMDFGRPHTIRLVVLVDRGHRQLPIEADYVGKRVTTSIGETIRVHLKEADGTDQVLLVGDE